MIKAVKNVQTFTKDQINKFTKEISRLRAYAGGDCPEEAFIGINGAMEEGNPKPKSPLYVFTDAPPKKPSRVDDAIALALDTWTTVHMFYGRGCMRTPHSAYHSLVSETNGRELSFSSGAEIKLVINVAT